MAGRNSMAARPGFFHQSRRFHSRPTDVATGVTGRLRSR